MCASIRVANPRCATKVKACVTTAEVGRAQVRHHRPIRFGGIECEHTCWDPKDGELCLRRAKPAETLVEARSGSDVQIDRQTWV